MLEIKIYKNYGVLGAEKRNVYTFNAPHYTATCFDEITAELPEDWNLSENYFGEIIAVSPWGWSYDINDILRGNDKPCFRAVDKDGKLHRSYLKISEERE